MTGTDRARWLKTFGHRGGPAAVRVFCFHHAGGTAARFRDWPEKLPWDVEAVAVQMPGRADRRAEPPFDAMDPLVERLVGVVEPMLDVPFAFFGLSMGGKVSWSLSRALARRALPTPFALYLANVAAPGTLEGRPDWSRCADDELVAYLREMGGTPAELLAEPALLAILLPTLRADLTLVDSYLERSASPLDVPIQAFAAADDVDCSPERMYGWQAETSAGFSLDVVPGGHFLDPAGEQQVVDVLTGDLLRVRQAGVPRSREFSGSRDLVTMDREADASARLPLLE